MEAAGNAEWTGTPLAPLLREAGIAPEAMDVVFTGADHGVERGVEQDYQRALPVADALRDEVLLAYEMNGAPLLPQHGAPLRLIVPGWYGMAHVKWLRTISVLTGEFDGYQNAVAYRLRRDADDPGVPVTRIEPRALVRPPGFPDFMSRSRVLRPGPCTVDGRAWSGHGPVVAVEVTTDGGVSWTPATLDPPTGGEWSWRRWRYEWTPQPGRYVAGGAGDRRVGAYPAGGATLEPGWLRQQPDPAGRRARASGSEAGGGVRPGPASAGGRPTRGGGQLPKPESAGSEMSGFSSSSTLTSLNVITRTFLTKRAGRYMSQTQASCISTSK